MKRIIQAGAFKAQCLKIMDEVQKSKQPLIITKRKVPIVKLVPIQKEQHTLFGKMRGTIDIKNYWSMDEANLLESMILVINLY